MRSGAFDVVILGSGFAGSILARALNRRGQRVLLVERGRHPRFALGESTTPLANLALERLGARHNLADLHQLAAYGRWLEHLPHLRRGLKRGFSFFAHKVDTPFSNSSANEARLLVAASPNDELADSHWLRRDLDEHMVLRALDEGVEYLERTLVEDFEITDRGVHLVVRGDSLGLHHVKADIIVDASGPEGAVAKRMTRRIGPLPVASGLLFGHFEGLRSLAEVSDAHFGNSPFPDEKAAIHHLLESGWMYQLPFDHGVVSAGFLLRPDQLPGSVESMNLEPDRAWRKILGRYPTLERQFGAARSVVAPLFVPRIQHRLLHAAGPRWFLLPHAFAFYDPLFSTGIAWSLLAVERLVDLLSEDAGKSSGRSWRTYDQLLHQEADQIEALIESAYATLNDFRSLTAIALTYFVSVSFSEAQQRLKPTSDDCWQGFLGAGDPFLSTLFVQMRDRLRHQRQGRTPSGGDFHNWLTRRLAPRDLMGVDRAPLPNLFPVDLELLRERCGLLGLEIEDFDRALPRLRGQAPKTEAT